MARDNRYSLPVTLVKHRGFFDYPALLQAINKWYIDDDFNLVNIPMYKQKFTQPTGTEHEMRIRGHKNVTEYVRFHIELFMRVYNLHDVEVIKDGKKVKMQEGQVQIEIRPEIEFDWQKRFEGPAPWKNFLEVLDNFYRKYIIKYKIGDYWEDMILFRSANLARVLRETLGQEVI